MNQKQLAEAVAWWENTVYMELSPDEEDHVRELAVAARLLSEFPADEQVEAAAKVLFKVAYQRDLGWAKAEEQHRDHYRRDARAALEAVRAEMFDEVRG